MTEPGADDVCRGAGGLSEAGHQSESLSLSHENAEAMQEIQIVYYWSPPRGQGWLYVQVQPKG